MSRLTIAFALDWLVRQYANAEIDERGPKTGRRVKGAQLYCKTLALVFHDRVLTDWPRGIKR